MKIASQLPQRQKAAMALLRARPLNRCGAFEPLHEKIAQLVVLGVAWTTFLVSLAPPSVRVFGPVLGYAAAWAAVTMPIDIVNKRGLHVALCLYVLIDAANTLMCLLPLIVWRLSRGGGEWVAPAFCVSMVVPWSFGFSDGMLIGYYVWCAGFAIALVALPLNTSVLLAMTLAAVIAMSVAGIPS